MNTSWKIYQNEAVSYFLSLGLKAETEVTLQGARGKHQIDVFVWGTYLGLGLKWIVECKDWARNVPKEKVLALQAVIQDLGVDKGILLSEVGFQSGAIRASNHTNITLTSLADLRSNKKQSLEREILKDLHWRWSEVVKFLSEIHRRQKDGCGHVTPALQEKIKVMFIDSAIEDGLRGEWPTVYAIDGQSERVEARTIQELILGCQERILHAQEYIKINS